MLDRNTETPTDGRALPATLGAAAARVLVRLHRSQRHLPTAGVLIVQCDGEQLVIPGRTYYDQPEVERIIAAGGMRHSLREALVRAITTATFGNSV